jgi:hypothetical protein
MVGKTCRSFGLGMMFSLIALSGAAAQAAPGASPPTSGTPAAGCLVAPASLSDSLVQAFLSSPPALLTEFPTGGIGLSNRVRSLVGTSGNTLDPIVGLVGQASQSQVAALGAGLARAAGACVAVNPDLAVRIQEAVAATDNAAFQAAFEGATPEVETAALGAAGGNAGASAIGGGGASAGGINSDGTSGTGGTQGTSSGNSQFSAGASGLYFATADAGSSTTTNAVSLTQQ